MAELTQEEAWVLSDRLSWYCHLAVPATVRLTVTEDDGEVRTMTRSEMYDYIMENPDSIEVAYARNMRTPEEEADRLINSGRVNAMEFTDGAVLIENDPYGRFKERYFEWREFKRRTGVS